MVDQHLYWYVEKTMHALSVEMKADIYFTYSTRSPKMLSQRDDVNKIVTGNTVK